MIKLKKVLKDATTMAAMPAFTHVPLEFGKKKAIPAVLPGAKIKLSDVLDRYERITGARR